MAKKSASSHSASDDDSQNHTEPTAHLNTLRKKNKSKQARARARASREGRERRTGPLRRPHFFLVHLYGNKMLFPELPLQVSGLEHDFRCVAKQHPEGKENCSRDQVKTLGFKTHKMTRCFNRLRLTGGGWDHVLHRPAYSDERWAAVGPNGPDPAPAPVNSDALINVCTNDVLHQLEERTRNGVRCTQARFRGTGTQQRSLVLATLAAPTGDVTDINALFNPGKRTASSSKKRAHSPQPEQSGADLGQDAESEGEDSPGPSLARLGVQDLTRPFWSPSPAAGAQAYVHTKAAFASLLNPLDPCQSSESATSSSNGGSKAKRESRENRKRFTYFQDKPMLKDAVANLTGLQNATTSERLSHFSKLVGTLSLEADDVPLLANHALLTPTPQDIQKVLLLAAAGVLIDLRVRQMINRLSFRPVSSSNALPSHEAPPPDSLQTRNTPYIFSLDFYARRGPYLRQLVHYLLWQSRKRRSMF